MMDITQETITLLRLRLESIRRQVGPVRKYRAGRNCQKGYNCGGSCITRRKNCRKALEGEAKDYASWLTSKLDPAKTAMFLDGGFSPGEAAGLSRKDRMDQIAKPEIESPELISTVEKVAQVGRDQNKINDFVNESLDVKTKTLNRFREEIAKDKTRTGDWTVPPDIMAQNESDLADAEREYQEFLDFANADITKDTLDSLPPQFRDVVEAGRRLGISDDNAVTGLQMRQSKLQREMEEAGIKSKAKAETDEEILSKPLPKSLTQQKKEIKRKDKVQYLPIGDQTTSPISGTVVGLSADGDYATVRPSSFTPEQKAEIKKQGRRDIYDQTAIVGELFAPDDDLSGYNELYQKKRNAYNRKLQGDRLERERKDNRKSSRFAAKMSIQSRLNKIRDRFNALKSST